MNQNTTRPDHIIPIEFRIEDCPPTWTRRRTLSLLLMLTKRHLTNRYRGTFLGFLWSFLNPLFMMMIYTFVLSVIIRFSVPEAPYALFFLSGYLFWNLFSIGIINAANSTIEGSQFYNHVDFPRLLLPVSAILSSAVNFAVSLPFFLLIMLLFRVTPTANFLLLPICLLLALIHTMAFGLIFSAFTPKYRDSLHFLEVLMQAWFFLTPIIYPLSLVTTHVTSPWMGGLYLANPMVGVLSMAHSCLLGTPLTWSHIGYSMALGVLLLALAVYLFQKKSPAFSEYV